MELVRGQVVQSRRGRDVTRWYVVAGLEGGGSGLRALCANGRRWTLAAPKKKNPVHLQPTKTVLSAAEMETDLQLKAALEAFVQRLGRTNEGG